MARDTLMRELGGLVLGQVRDALNKRSSTQLQQAADEPPVVAQLMIEIRSDGSRTIARGALNDLITGESAQVHAEGRTPSDLIMSLATSLLALPTTLFDSPAKRRAKELEREARSRAGAGRERSGPRKV
ncbi:MAG: hypothetical protein RL701_506 [Pseudomonadota bacterium]|jgi:hypothetical protein